MHRQKSMDREEGTYWSSGPRQSRLAVLEEGTVMSDVNPTLQG